MKNAEEIIEYDELQGLIKHQLDCLPEKTQRIFNLSRKEHYTHCEIAEKLNCSPKTVEYHIGKALQHLRFNLKDHITILITFILLSIAVY
ncbi:MAG: sigma factor-like helix-turn-helix DNA-binding protein [Balneolales bacterium]